jgi:glycosyltransferase involved in cell wall biosynthesis
VVFVQSPPSFAPALVALYARLTGAAFVIDIHSDAMLTPHWARPRRLHRWVRRRAAASIVTNEAFRDQIEQEGGTALLIRDIPTTFEVGPPPALGGGGQVLVVSSFADDEPLEAIAAAAGLCPEVEFHMTGSLDRAPRAFLDRLPPNLRMTGYLPDPDYYGLMGAVDAVMCLTTRDNTMQRGACEALSMRRPIITSDWPLLRAYFDRGTVHVGSTPEDIAAGVKRALRNRAALIEEVDELAGRQQTEWVEARRRLSTLFDGTERE